MYCFGVFEKLFECMSLYNQIIQKTIFTFQPEAVNWLLRCVTSTAHSLDIIEKTGLRQRLLLWSFFTFLHSVATWKLCLKKYHKRKKVH